jgi:hypothetical protein
VRSADARIAPLFPRRLVLTDDNRLVGDSRGQIGLPAYRRGANLRFVDHLATPRLADRILFDLIPSSRRLAGRCDIASSVYVKQGLPLRKAVHAYEILAMQSLSWCTGIA